MIQQTPTYELKEIFATDRPPIQFEGVHVERFQSRNANVTRKDAKQWFTIDVYKTSKGTWIAHCHYEAGSKLAREVAKYRVFYGPTICDLVDVLDGVDTATMFVTGWPDEGRPYTEHGKDFTREHRSVCEYAQQQWRDAVDQIALVFKTEQPEIIE